MPLAIQTLPGTSHEESAGLMDPKESPKMQIATIEQVNRASFPNQLVHDPRIMDTPTGDDHDGRNVAAQVEQCMELHRGFAATKLSPREKRQTQIDDGRVQRVNGMHQVHTKGLVRVQLTSSLDQYLSKIGIDPPIAHLIRMRQSIARYSTTNAHVIQLGGPSAQTRFNIPKTLAISQLSKSHGQELIPTRKPLDFVITAIALDAPAKLIPRSKIHQLSKNRLTNIHRNPPLAKLPKEQLRSESNR